MSVEFLPWRNAVLERITQLVSIVMSQKDNEDPKESQTALLLFWIELEELRSLLGNPPERLKADAMLALSRLRRFCAPEPHIVIKELITPESLDRFKTAVDILEKAQPWKAPYSGSAPKSIGQLIGKIDLMEALADQIELPIVSLPGAPPSENGTAAMNSHDVEAPNPNLSVDDLAVSKWISLVKQGETPTISRVAREIRHPRQYLYDCPTFMAVVNREKAERESRKARMPRGRKDNSKGVEAFQDET